MNRQRLVVGTLGAFGFMSAIAAIGYGCSSKGSDAATATDPDTGVIERVDSSTPDNPVDSSVADSAAAQVFKAYATITSTTLAGAVAAGQATFTEQDGEVTVVVDMSAADPASTMHGIHIHQNGSCGDNDSGVGGAIVNAGAAGPHWNPTDAGHGYPTAAVHHVGDMGNISIGADGKGKLTLLSKEWTVQPGPKSVVGHALIFHIRQDDGMSQPVGDAGTRPGCAVIGTTAPPPPTPCLDNTLAGAAPACAAGCTTQCATIDANFKKGVAADAVKTLTGASCTANTADTTTSASVAKACADATAKAFCDALVAGGCSAGLFPSFPTQCLTLTNGLSGTGTGAAATLGRMKLYDCINTDPNRDCTTCQDFVKGKN
jgi:Cu-Zn family superoxide dismutase